MSTVILKKQRSSIPRSPTVLNLRDVIDQAEATFDDEDSGSEKEDVEMMEADHPKYNSMGGYHTYKKLYIEAKEECGIGCANAVKKMVDLTWETGRDHEVCRRRSSDNRSYIYEVIPEYPDQFQMEEDLVD